MVRFSRSDSVTSFPPLGVTAAGQSWLSIAPEMFSSLLGKGSFYDCRERHWQAGIDCLLHVRIESVSVAL
jgi:hypothetical protein